MCPTLRFFSKGQDSNAIHKRQPKMLRERQFYYILWPSSLSQAALKHCYTISTNSFECNYFFHFPNSSKKVILNFLKNISLNHLIQDLIHVLTLGALQLSLGKTLPPSEPIASSTLSANSGNSGAQTNNNKMRSL